MRPDDRKYLKSHEWAKIDGETATIGITDFAVSQLSDLTFLDLPEVGDEITAGERFGEIESVKAVSDLIAPVSGEVVKVHGELPDELDTLVEDPFDKGWMLEVKVSGTSDDLLDASEYEKLVEAES